MASLWFCVKDRGRELDLQTWRWRSTGLHFRPVLFACFHSQRLIISLSVTQTWLETEAAVGELSMNASQRSFCYCFTTLRCDWSFCEAAGLLWSGFRSESEDGDPRRGSWLSLNSYFLCWMFLECSPWAARPAGWITATSLCLFCQKSTAAIFVYVENKREWSFHLLR